jgi:hypothetical protein
MKRFLALVGCFITLACACFAQDVIVTRDSKRINALVTQVNVDDVRYKHFDNPNGSTYMLQKSNIAAILYQNGKVETFEKEDTNIQTAVSTPVQTNTTTYTPEQRTTQPNQYQTQSQRTRQWNQYSQYQDIVYLKNGSIIRGIIVEQIPNSSITIETTEGNIFILRMEEIESLTKVPSIDRNNRSSQSRGTGLRRGFKGIFEVGHLFGTGDYSINRIKLNLLLGHQANPYFSFGFGFGLRYFYTNDSYYDDSVVIPILSDFRVNFINKPVSPYLSCGIGYSLYWNESSSEFQGIGLLLNPTAGVTFKVASRAAIHVGLGFENQYWGNEYNDYGINYGAVNLVFGVSF